MISWSMTDAVAKSIFDAENEWREMEDLEPWPERHYKVAVSYYHFLANKAIKAYKKSCDEVVNTEDDADES